MTVVLRQALAELRRRRLQTAVVAIVALLASAAATMAADLLLETDAPFDHAFAAAAGAHLTVRYDASVVDRARVEATERAAGVTAASGPWAVLDVVLGPGASPVAGAVGPPALPAFAQATGRTRGEPGRGPARPPAQPVPVIGRDRPDTAVDRLALDAGRWAAAPGEVVVSRPLGRRFDLRVGDRLVAQRLASPVELTVVGVAASVISEPEAWVRPPDLPALAEPGSRLRYQVAYRVSPAATPDDIGAAARSITAGLPPKALVDSVSYLDVKRRADLLSSVMVPFLVAFGVFALAATVLIVGNVVSGVVIGSYRDIGVMKSIGFAPRQVSAVLALEVLLPALVGALTGAGAGTLGSVPFLARTAAALDLPAPATAHVPIAAAVVAGLAVLVLLASLAPAGRAARMSAVDAITRGSAPARAGNGRPGAALAGLPLPGAVRLGLGGTLARPLRAAMTMGAVATGVATAVFALGLHLSLTEVAHHLIRDHYAQVQVHTLGGASADRAERLIAADPGTARSVAEGIAEVSVTGVARPIPYFGYRGDASWIGYALIRGRWFAGAGEVVAPTRLLRQAGLHVGDRFTAVARGSGTPMRLRLVGEILDQEDDDLLLRGDWASLAAAEPGARIDRFDVQVRPDTDPAAYAERLARSGGGVLVAATTDSSDTDESFLLLQSVVAGLALVLTGIAVAGVFNTVVLDTRERFRDVAIMKAVGMGPRQVVTMVVASVAGLGLVAGAIGVPIGLELHGLVLDLMGRVASGTAIPPVVADVFARWQLPALALAGVAVAAGGAWLPAGWAARAPVAEVLQAE